MRFSVYSCLIFLLFNSSLFGQTGVNENHEFSIVYNIKIPESSPDDWEIMHMKADGSEKKNITNNGDVAWIYTASTDRLFFISDRDTCYRCFFLYECDATGNSIRKVSDLMLEDSWMDSRNSGKEMIVSGRVGKELRYQLFLINTKSGRYKQITNDLNAMFRDPSFSPDGKWIACSYKANKSDRNISEELYLLDSKGKNLKQLTHYPEKDRIAKIPGYRAGSSRWHPNENFISFVTMRDGKHSIYAVTPDGSKEWKLLESNEADGWHDWSSDGKWLVYNSSDIDESQYHIRLMNWKTKESVQLTDTKYKSQLSPVFVEH